MLELKDIRYNIKKEDMYLTKFPYWKVLQPKYGLPTRQADELKSSIIEYIKANRTNKFDANTVNEGIYTIVHNLQKKYPSWFDDIGWYTRRLIVNLFVEGRLQCDGSVTTLQEMETLETLRTVEREAIATRERERNRLYAEAFGEYLEEQERIYNANRELSIGYIEVGDTFKNKAEIVDALDIYLKDIKAYARKWLTVPEYLEVEYYREGGYWEVKGIVKGPIGFYRMESWLHHVGAKRSDYEQAFKLTYKEEQA
jgi:hypothetical protein